ncbi:Myb-like DNA-binding domain containing protein [Trichomonas vaginalis G3]|uniref:Myb-like DNA-binding domain containing protein n=1 Tax=Trichomonas vaginalis (strain ATCC PRA-98 / G3) TaxID=412133 RepID=A2GBM1_TRIV3|nr:RNA polymerase II transcription regulator recruiting protein [Trichomonas vaginalis G3]EAX85445.1 Myb-like DNA-binding domain containing protein [Trichomonas vaginalis G3]KAI5516111.1 RNA polymerase II transcription regulator recruiting protein [Trichomonas vaginalis G3]|eukprot:XP_001298375.1 Myb-like DNA-binding domain containing protein [Trichomonas vaginalis G3]
MYSQKYSPYEKHKEQRIIFTKAEDEKLKRLVEKSGRRPNWKSISAAMKTRSPRQCRERYRNYLNPNIEHSEFTKEEDEIILSQFAELGNQWKKISESLHGRTGNSIRNRYHSLVRQQQRMSQLNINSYPQTQKKEIKASTNENSQEQAYNIPEFLQSMYIPLDSIFFDDAPDSN